MLPRTFDHLPDHTNESRILSGPRLVRDRRNDEVVTVVERRADGVAGARGPSCLIFSTDAGFTRVWWYPANWRDLRDAELMELTEHWRHSRSA